MADPKAILDFWFSPRVSKFWFASTPEFDAELTQAFETVLKEAIAGKLNGWQESAEGALALVIVLDQFPLNMYRGRAESFATGDDAVKVAQAAVDRGFGQRLPKNQLAFLYLPFMHSERLEDQDKSVELFTKAGLSENLKFAHHHREIVRKFGRFPHRNEALGRKSTPEELAYLNSKEGYHG